MKVPISTHDCINLDAPTLRAYELRTRAGAVRWVVWCEHCRLWHYHGAGDGHREAHCSETTPYTKTGYNLALRGKWREYYPIKSPEDC